MKSKICGVLGLVLFLLSAASGQTGQSPDELKLFQLINRERGKAGLPAFHWDYVLAEVARDHLIKMVQHKQLSHQFPGEPPLSDRIAATSLRFNSASESVAAPSTVESAHQGLMNSESDKGSILSQQYNALGLAVVTAGDELYLVEDFAWVLPVYSEVQFRKRIVSAFDKARQAKGIEAIDTRPDPRLQKAVCAGRRDSQGGKQDSSFTSEWRQLLVTGGVDSPNTSKHRTSPS